MNTLSHNSCFAPIPLTTLLNSDLPDLQWIIPGLLPQGLTLLLGQPRIGKSWLALQIALSTTLSTPVLDQLPIPGADVLYLGLQDTPSRMTSRCRKLLGDHPIPNNFSWSSQCNPLHPDGLTALDNWLNEHPQMRLLVIDSLHQLSPSFLRSPRTTSQDQTLLHHLQDLASRHHLAILLVHSLPCRTSRDPLNELLRLPALYTADALLLLNRQRGQSEATLLVNGPDLPEQELALCFEQDSMQWTVLGKAADYRLSQQRQDILAVLRECNDGPLSPKQIASLLHKDVRAVTKLLHDMSHAHQLRLLGRGQYMLAKIPSSDIPQHHHSSALLSSNGNNGNNPSPKMETQQGSDVEQNNRHHTPEPLPQNPSSDPDTSNDSNIGNVISDEPTNFLPLSDASLPIAPNLLEDTNRIQNSNEAHNPYFPID